MLPYLLCRNGGPMDFYAPFQIAARSHSALQGWLVAKWLHLLIHTNVLPTTACKGPEAVTC
jgi:hypothetical protein